MKRLFMGAALLLGSVSSLLAQEPAGATWPITSTQTATANISGQIAGANMKLVGLEQNGWGTIGTTSVPKLRMPNANGGWPAGMTGEVSTVYIEFAVSTINGSTFNATNISLDLCAVSISTAKANIYYSTDATFATKTQIPTGSYLSSSALTNFTATINETISTGTLYLRVYPWIEMATANATKYVGIQNVTISGTYTGGIAPTIPLLDATTAATSISTTFATCGGKITSDGYKAVTERGLCWTSASTDPTIADSKLVIGSGVGSFSGQLTNLTANTTYRVCSYATNAVGTAYGAVTTFTTLAAIVVPTVTTGSASTVMAEIAQMSGNVTEWGGADVTARGFVWNTTGNATVTQNDGSTLNGSGLGAINGPIAPLTPGVTYKVRAYATNSAGTGYGTDVTVVTLAKALDVTKVVNPDGTGDYTTIQEAFTAVPEYYTGTWTIKVKPGTYNERATLASTKYNVVLLGEDANTTIITNNAFADTPNGSGGTLGTNGCQTVAIDANDFIAKNITFQNTYINDGIAVGTPAKVPNQQAVALRTKGDRQEYYNCRMLGYQDTYYTNSDGRIYMKDCFIEGSVDFIFGGGAVLIENSTINMKNNSTICAPATATLSAFGYVFKNCKITTDANTFKGTAFTSITLGRPWQNSPRCVYFQCDETQYVAPIGWEKMSVQPTLFAEYKCTGAGAVAAGTNGSRGLGGVQLTDVQAADYTTSNIFSKTTFPTYSFDWMPSEPASSSIKNVTKESHQLEIDENPVVEQATISYVLESEAKVVLAVYNSTGAVAANLVNETQSVGEYDITISANKFKTGIYYLVLNVDGKVETQKLVIK